MIVQNSKHLTDPEKSETEIKKYILQQVKLIRLKKIITQSIISRGLSINFRFEFSQFNKFQFHRETLVCKFLISFSHSSTSSDIIISAPPCNFHIGLTSLSGDLLRVLQKWLRNYIDKTTKGAQKN